MMVRTQRRRSLRNWIAKAWLIAAVTALPAIAWAAPVLSIVSPGHNATVSGTFRVQVQVSDATGLTGMSVLLSTDGGGNWSHTLTPNSNYAVGSNAAIYEVQLNLAPSVYSLRAKATNASSITTTSLTLPVTVVAAKLGDGHILRRDNSSQLCTDCHALQSHSSQALGQKYGAWSTNCRDCHTPHGTSNAYLIGKQITPPGALQPKDVYFSNRSGVSGVNGATNKPSSSFVNNDMTGVCQVCHTQTSRFTNSTLGNTSHGGDCASCHNHSAGFGQPVGSCTTCHGDASRTPVTGADANVRAAPPNDSRGYPGSTAVGAHMAHINKTNSTLRRTPLACSECHSVPADGNPTATHRDGQDSVVFSPGTLATKVWGGGASLSAFWNQGNLTCTGTYCHGNFRNGANAAPTWTAVGPLGCTSCHGDPPGGTHQQINTDCNQCHSGYTQTSVNLSLHMNGQVDVEAPTSATCTTCHGTAGRTAYSGLVDPNLDSAPPLDATLTPDGPKVGAHQAHLNPTPATAIANPLACDDCHYPTPTSTSHSDGSSIPSFYGLANTGGAVSAYDPGTLTCSNTYCHGNFRGGLNTSLTWGGTAPCGSCHLNEPGLPHPQNTACVDCHGTGYSASSVTGAAVATHVDGQVTLVASHAGCTACHGDSGRTLISGADANAKSAPPYGSRGETDTTSRAVGAHLAHLNQKTFRNAPLACADCHTVPPDGDVGHANGTVAMTWGSLARTGGASPSFSTSNLNCSNVYCHGGTSAVQGGTNTTPSWTGSFVPGTSSLTCSSCHGNPPTRNGHPQRTDCGTCHTGYTNTSVNASLHVNGTVDVITNFTCTTCHGTTGLSGVAGSDPNVAAAPPVDTRNQSATSVVGVGAHRVHVNGTRSKPVACSECHYGTVPQAPNYQHETGTVAFAFGTLARLGSVSPIYPVSGGSCSATYCHGNFSGGSGAGATPAWVTSGTLACNACHGNPPALPHPQDTTCADCHGAGYSSTTVVAATHVDGIVTLLTSRTGCTECHGDGTRAGVTGADANVAAAPPIGSHGETATTARVVGAHLAHVNQTTFRRSPLACTECHVVPAAGNTSHANGAVNITFGALASTGSVTPLWDTTDLNCSTVYCHGGTSAVHDGTNTTPDWTGVFTPGASTLTCTSCHGAPPAANGHPNRTDCGTCHTGYTSTSVNLDLHINGSVEVRELTCTSCHGNADLIANGGTDPNVKAAPPLDTHSNSATTVVGVGVHQSHVNSSRSKPVACSECHYGAVPTQMTHSTGTVVVAWGTTAKTGGVTPSYTLGSGGSCSATYCHGNFTGGAGAGPTSQTWVQQGTLGCASCHGNPPPVASAPYHPTNSTCAQCHGTGYSSTSVVAATHVNGSLELPSRNNACNKCHGQLDGYVVLDLANADPQVIAAPGTPATNSIFATGAHAKHVNPQLTSLGGASKPFRCSECHYNPTGVGGTYLQASDHSTVSAYPVWTGSLYATAGSMAPVYVAGTCSNTYCHAKYSSGTYAGVPGAEPAPSWNGTNAAGCSYCHGNPPAANGHPQRPDCGSCHDSYTNASVNAALHINGTVDVRSDLSCTSCHGNASLVTVAGADANVKAAPPIDTRTNGVTTAIGVGVHQVHVNGSRSMPVACSECHSGAVPASNNLLHETGAVTVAWGSVARTGGVTPSYTVGSGASCSATYCHGNFSGGAGAGPTSQTWVQQGTLACTACHGNPPANGSAPYHPTNTVCAQCHNQAGDASLYTTSAVNASTHVNGTVELPNRTGACNRCHGWLDAGATAHDGAGPFVAASSPAANAIGAPGTAGSAGRTFAAGAHTAHVNQANAPFTAAMACGECHYTAANGGVYTSGSDGHVDGNGLPSWTATSIAKKGGMTPAYNSGDGTCSNTYCHTKYLTSAAPQWGTAGKLSCTSCHANPPPVGSAPWHPTNSTCTDCHGAGYSSSAVTGGALATHVDGSVTLPNRSGACNTCHGQTNGFQAYDSANADNNVIAAPGITNATYTTPGVAGTNSTFALGSHQKHVNPRLQGAGGLSKPYKCTECHGPAKQSASDHAADGTGAPATSDFGTIATSGGMTASYAGGTCSNTYCHAKYSTGAYAVGNPDAHPSPSWNETNAVGCTWCHGVPPALTTSGGAHSTSTDCGSCHDGYTSTSVNVALHANGTVDVKTLTCTSCHGDSTRSTADTYVKASPPKDTSGASSGSKVGAHLVHVYGGDSGNPRSKLVACSECHYGAVPALDNMSHSNGSVDIAWGTLATTGAVTPSYAGSCSATYCHGNFEGGVGAGASPTWATAGTLACTSCHLDPPVPSTGTPKSYHPNNSNCVRCHGTGYSSTTVVQSTHVDGMVQRNITTGCTQCHGDVTQTIADNTSDYIAPGYAAGSIDTHDNSLTSSPGVGAHAKHLTASLMTPSTCTECHPSRSVGDRTHANGLVELAWSSPANIDIGQTLYPTFSTVSDQVTWEANPGTTDTCTNYCHSNAAPAGGGAVRTTNWPKWTGSAMTCTSCHQTTGRDQGGADNTYLSQKHGRHINANATSYSYTCSECHASTMAASSSTVIGTPANHVNGGKEVVFSSSFGLPPYVNQSAVLYTGGTCATYCHSDGTSATSFSAVDTALSWTTGSASCTSCHGGASGANHVIGSGHGSAKHTQHVDNASVIATNVSCGLCHASTVTAGNDTQLTGRANHVNGQVDVSLATINGKTSGAYAAGGARGTGSCASSYCHSTGQDPAATNANRYKSVAWNDAAWTGVLCKKCHGAETSSGYFASQFGEPNYANGGAGATTANSHQLHVTAVGDCDKCHANTTATPGLPAAPTLKSGTVHLNGSLNVVIAAVYDLSATGGVNNYNYGTKTCSNISCHGAGLSIQWGADSLGCAACHGTTRVGSSTLASRTIGTDPNVNAAPPWDTTGANSGVRVGAHVAHVNQTTLRTSALLCTDCHPAPSYGTHNGTLDAAWSTLATNSGAVAPTPTAVAGYNGSWGTTPGTNDTCTNYCHGTGLTSVGGGGSSGGTNKSAVWTGGSTQAQCSSCHGAPPPLSATTGEDHPQNTNCASCHGTGYDTGGLSAGAKATHVDRTVQAPNNGCTACHGVLAGAQSGGFASSAGGVTNASMTSAPGYNGTGYSTTGQYVATNVKVGAHDLHVRNPSLMSPVTCTECHPLPANGDTAHANNLVAMSWGYPANNGVTAAPTFANLAAQQAWELTPGTTDTCTNYCHSNATPAGGGTATTASPKWTSTVDMTCTSCHKTTGRDQGGAADYLSQKHGRHINGSGNNSYAYACYECHTATMQAGSSTVIGTPGKHVDGSKDVSFSASFGLPPYVNQSAVVYTGGTCATYCHSDGTSPTTFNLVSGATALAWTTATADATCASCHAGNATSAYPFSTSPARGSAKHLNHVNNASVIVTNVGCGQCHSATVTLGDDRTITGRANHVNGQVDVSMPAINGQSNGTYVAGGSRGTGSCASSYCHSTGQDPGATNPTRYKSVAWNDAAWTGVICTKCHGAETSTGYFVSLFGEPNYANGGAGSTTANSHQLHVSAVGDCDKCHTNTTSTTGSPSAPTLKSGTAHLNGSKNVVIAAAYDLSATGGVNNYDTATKKCSNISCHGSGVVLQWGADTGGSSDCTQCHGIAPQRSPSVNPLTSRSVSGADQYLNASPPYDSTGVQTGTKVGAHLAHVAQSNTYPMRSTPLACYDCHPSVYQSGTKAQIYAQHNGTRDAGWSTLATNGGAVSPTPAAGATYTSGWESSPSCTNYCHGTGLKSSAGATDASSGGTKTATWTAAGPLACNACHGSPPPLLAITGYDHPQNSSCAACHGTGYDTTPGISGTARTTHVNRTVEAPNNGCTACHGVLAGAQAGGFATVGSVNNASLTSAPGYNGTGMSTTGTSLTSSPKVGGHDAHVRPSGHRNLAGAFGCATCHGTIPANQNTSHADTTIALSWATPAYVTGVFNSGSVLPTAFGAAFEATPGTSDSCTNYCHGGKYSGNASYQGTITSPKWTLGSSQSACGSCHKALPTDGKHGAVSLTRNCGDCHTGYNASADGSLFAVNTITHINGSVDSSLTCYSCHGTSRSAAAGVGTYETSTYLSAAPPTDATYLRSGTGSIVGPHLAHVNPDPSTGVGQVYLPVKCSDCHGTAYQTYTTTHADGNLVLDLSGSSGASQRTTTVTWTAAGPVLTSATPSTSGGTLAANTYYYRVSAITAGGETLGSNEVLATTTGSTSSVALSWNAYTGATGYRVYRGTSSAGESVYYAPGNVTGYTDTNAGSTAGSPVTATCNTYCHGDNLPQADLNRGRTSWTWTTGTTPACNMCHGTPPSTAGHNGLVANDLTACSGCHGTTVDSTGKIKFTQNGGVYSTTHINGQVDTAISGNSDCVQCHADIVNPMQTVFATGVNNEVPSYHHYLSNSGVGGVTSPYTAATAKYPTAALTTNKYDVNRRCLMCHVDHDAFGPDNNPTTGGRGKNLRAEYGVNGIPNISTGAGFANTDFDNAQANGGLCISCHKTAVSKVTPQVDGTATSPAIVQANYNASAHNYTAQSAFSNAIPGTNTFNANCSKCHNDTRRETKQTSGFPNQFGLHDSVLRRVSNQINDAIATVESGTATGGTTTSVQDTSQTWTTDQWKGYYLTINDLSSDTATGTQSTTQIQDTKKSWTTNQWVGSQVTISDANGARSSTVTSNNATTLFVSPAFAQQPIDGTTSYSVSYIRVAKITGNSGTTLNSDTTWPAAPATTTVYNVTAAPTNGTATGGTTTTIQDSSKAWTSGQFVGQLVTVANTAKGTATGASQSTTQIQDTSQSWNTNEFLGGTVTITDSTYGARSSTVTANTASTITVNPAFANAPINGTTTYRVVSGNRKTATITANSANQLTINPALAAAPAAGRTIYYVLTGMFTAQGSPQSTTQLTDSTKSWKINQFAGWTVTITDVNGTRSGVVRANTATTLLVVDPWAAAPVAGSTVYTIDDPIEERQCAQCHSGGVAGMDAFNGAAMTATAKRFDQYLKVYGTGQVTATVGSTSLAGASSPNNPTWTQTGTSGSFTNGSAIVNLPAGSAMDATKLGWSIKDGTAPVRWYTIVGINSPTQLTISPKFQGTTTTTASWTIAPGDWYFKCDNDTMGGWYRVTDVTSATAATIYPAYGGSTCSNSNYVFRSAPGHPMGITAGRHKPDEVTTSGWNGGTTRHVTCTDCHDPHDTKPGRHTPGNTSASNLPAVNNGVWGVTPTYVSRSVTASFTAASRNITGATNTFTSTDVGKNIIGPDGSAYNIATVTGTTAAVIGTATGYRGSTAANAVVTIGDPAAAPTFTTVSSLTTANSEYQLCFKCHSAYGYGASPPNTMFFATSPIQPTTPNATTTSQTDASKDFNPFQYAFHPIYQKGRNQPATSANTAWTGVGRKTTSAAYTNNPRTGLDNTFVDGWGTSSLVTCTDCHSSESSDDPWGPHGTANQWMLKGINPYVTVTIYTSATLTYTAQPNICFYTGSSTPAAGVPDTGDSKNLCLNCHRADVYGLVTAGGSGSGSSCNNTATIGTGILYAAFSRLSHPVDGKAHSNSTNISNTQSALTHWGIYCMQCHGGESIGGIHGTNAPAGSAGGTSYRGKRFLNGANWVGITRPSSGVSKSGTCYPGGTANNPAVNTCNAHGGGSVSISAGANYDYESGAD